MKTIISTIIALFAAIAVTQAQNLKIATVDVEQIYVNFYKVKEAEASIRSSFEIAKQESEALRDELKDLAAQIQEQQGIVDNSMMSEEKQNAAREKIRSLNQEGSEKQLNLQQFMQTAQRNLEDRQRSQRAVLLGEIREVAVAIAKQKGANLLFDNSGLTGTGVPTVMYSDAAWEITDEVLGELNKSAPK